MSVVTDDDKDDDDVGEDDDVNDDDDPISIGRRFKRGPTKGWWLSGGGGGSLLVRVRFVNKVVVRLREFGETSCVRIGSKVSSSKRVFFSTKRYEKKVHKKDTKKDKKDL